MPDKNYGWTLCDGVFPPPAGTPSTTSPYTAPIAQFRQGTQIAVTGGYVYRGTALGENLRGAYIFSEVYNGQLFVIDRPYEYVTSTGASAVTNTYEHPLAIEPEVAQLPRFRVIPQVSLGMLVSFTEDEDGELYAVTFSPSKGEAVLELVPTTGPPPADTIPALLSQTGCVDAADPTQPASGLIPYDLNAAFWSDGADKQRFFAIPDGTQIRVGADGDWELPNDSVVMKHFRLGGKLIETRLLVRHTDGGWAGYTYVWRDDQTDAVRAAPAGESLFHAGQRWNYPSRSGCLGCHTMRAGSSLGLETRQLDRPFHYDATNRTANQLTTLQHLGMFEAAPDKLEAYAEPFGTAETAARARAYLHTNCSQCHRNGDMLDLRYDATERLPCDATLRAAIPRLLRDPDPTTRMPKSPGTMIDDAGATLVADWLQTAACP